MASQQSAEFAINLNADGTIGPAEEAAGALDKLRKSIEGDLKGIKEMEAAMRNMKKGGLESSDAFAKLKGQLDLKRRSLAESQAAYVTLGGQLGDIGKKTKASAKEFSALGEVAKRLPGPLGSIVGKLVEFGSSAAAAKALALKVGFIALSVGIIAATGALLRYGIVASEARRNEEMQLEGLSKIRDWYGRTADSAGFLQSAVDKVSATTALGRGDVAKYTEQLYRMGLRAGNLQQALEGVTLVASTQGEGQAGLFMSLAAGAAFAGQSVKRLTDDAKARLGNLAARQMLSLDVQMRKLRENISFLFSGLKIEGFLKSLNEVTALFSANTASGRALKTLFEALFQPMINGFETVGPLAKRFFQGIIITALLVTIGFLKIRNAIKNAFGFEALDGTEKMRLALLAGVVVGGLLLSILAAIAVKALILAAPFLALAAAIAGAFYVGYQLGQMFIWLGEKAFAFDWAGLGKDIVNGIVNGVKNGAKWLIDAMRNLGKSGWKAFKDVLGIASPSKLMMATSLELPRGSAIGIKAGIPEVKKATEQLASVVPRTFEARIGTTEAPRIPSPTADSDSPAARTAPVARGGALGGSRTITINSITIETKATDAKSIAADFKDQLMVQLQDLLGTMGGEPA